MSKINREDIQIISSHSNWSISSVEKALQDNVYNSSGSWKKFLKLILLVLGIGFSVAGIIFFFAYNWAHLNKFAKIGIVQSLIIITTALAIIPRSSQAMKNIFLTGASVLIGVLFAVFGQIYQTGANAFDFFLAWTICITIWVLVSGFAPLWLIWIALMNTVIVLYSQQVANTWRETDVLVLLTILNALILLSSLFLNWSKTKIHIWFTNTIALAVVSFSTIGICIGIFDKFHPSFAIQLLVTAILYISGFFYGIRNKRAFYLSVIPFSLIIIIATLLIKISDNEWMFLLASLFIIGSVTFLIIKLIGLQKTWANEAGR